MAATKISEMTAITAVDTASGDLFTVVDVSATANKSITRDQLVTMVANNATGLTSALTATDSAVDDLFLVYDASAATMKDITRDEMIVAVANNVTSLTATLAGASTAADDLFLVYDASATAMKDITREELVTAVADNLTVRTTALPGASTAADDLFLIHDTSAAVMKDITRTELISAVATNLPAQSVANAALQNALVATTSFKVTSSGAACLRLLTATASLNFGNLVAQSKLDLTITVTGAVVGDAVFLGLPTATTAGIIHEAYVSAADTVTVRANNFTSGAIDPAAMTFRVVVMGF
jgi:hypothetical protein